MSGIWHTTRVDIRGGRGRGHFRWVAVAVVVVVDEVDGGELGVGGG